MNKNKTESTSDLKEYKHNLQQVYIELQITSSPSVSPDELGMIYEV
jgi:hypothetical protein